MELLETPESPTHFSDLWLLLPSLRDLTQRLKPKLVQDPMLDEDGKPYTYLNVSRFVSTTSNCLLVTIIYKPDSYKQLRNVTVAVLMVGMEAFDLFCCF